MPRATSSPTATSTRTSRSTTAKILPGEYYATNKDMALVTVLGSCVSACLRDRDTGIGGMNHFMLPDEGKLVGRTATSPRAGATACTRWSC